MDEEKKEDVQDSKLSQELKKEYWTNVLKAKEKADHEIKKLEGELSQEKRKLLEQTIKAREKERAALEAEKTIREILEKAGLEKKTQELKQVAQLL